MEEAKKYHLSLSDEEAAIIGYAVVDHAKDFKDRWGPFKEKGDENKEFYEIIVELLRRIVKMGFNDAGYVAGDAEDKLGIDLTT